MDRLIAPNSVPSGEADTAPVSGTPQYATSGSPGGLPPTVFPAYAWNAIQEELLAVIAGASISFDRTNNAQLAAAVAKLILISQGSYRALSFKSGNYTTVTSDTGTIVELAATASGSATFKVIDGVKVGDALGFVNQSNFNLTIQINTGSSANFIGVGVPVGTSFVIPANGNAEIIWGGVNWRVNNFSGAYAGSGTVGSYSSVSFQSTNYTTQQSDAGSLLILAAATAGNSTFTIADGTFQGQAIEVVNQSLFTLTMQIAGGSSANFIGTGVPLGTTFLIPPGGAAQIVWGSLNWRVPYFSPTGAGNYLSAAAHSVNYTVLASDFGSVQVFGSAAPAGVVLSVPDGISQGQTLCYFNNSAFPQTVQKTGGATGLYYGNGLLGASSFTLQSRQSAIAVWGGLNWLVLYISGGGFSSSASLAAASGWKKEPDGSITQWGSGTLAAGTDTITFPIAFPNGPYKASFKAGCRATGINTNNPVSADHSSPTTTGATVWGFTGATTPYWYEIRGN